MASTLTVRKIWPKFVLGNFVHVHTACSIWKHTDGKGWSRTRLRFWHGLALAAARQRKVPSFALNGHSCTPSLLRSREVIPVDICIMQATAWERFQETLQREWTRWVLYKFHAWIFSQILLMLDVAGHSAGHLNKGKVFYFKICVHHLLLIAKCSFQRREINGILIAKLRIDSQRTWLRYIVKLHTLLTDFAAAMGQWSDHQLE